MAPESLATKKTRLPIVGWCLFRASHSAGDRFPPAPNMCFDPRRASHIEKTKMAELCCLRRSTAFFRFHGNCQTGLPLFSDCVPVSKPAQKVDPSLAPFFRRLLSFNHRVPGFCTVSHHRRGFCVQAAKKLPVPNFRQGVSPRAWFLDFSKNCHPGFDVAVSHSGYSDRMKPVFRHCGW